MMSERKLFWLLWFWRSCLLFGTLSCLFAAYVSSFVDPDITKSYALITVALLNGMFFFSTFPGHRMDIRFNQLKRTLSERTDFDDTLPAEASMKNDLRGFIKFTIALMILIVFMIINFLLAVKANSNSNHPTVFSHMVVIIAASFVFHAFSLICKVDETFKKLEKLISQLKGT